MYIFTCFRNIRSATLIPHSKIGTSKACKNAAVQAIFYVVFTAFVAGHAAASRCLTESNSPLKFRSYLSLHGCMPDCTAITDESSIFVIQLWELERLGGAASQEWT